MGAERKVEKVQHSCPYCDEEIGEATFPYCQACEVKLIPCPKCKKPVKQDVKKCPYCGAKIKG